jgi:hypothetical protein
MLTISPPEKRWQLRRQGTPFLRLERAILKPVIPWKDKTAASV